MAIDEVFPSPTVKQVIFQIRFPNLFFLESRIGEYQIAIMDRFPESRFAIQRNFVVASAPPGVKEEDLPEHLRDLKAEKIWTFASPEGVRLSVHSDSLDIVSEVHKTYSNPRGEPRFRDLIEFGISRFLELTSLPVLKRLGLRYTDECPVPAKDNDSYREYYATAFPLDRFPISDALEMVFQARLRRGEYFLIFREMFKDQGEAPTLIMDFDGYAENVSSSGYLAVTDALHDLVQSAYQDSIKEPVYQHMRRPKE